MRQNQFRPSVLVVAISLMATGGAFAQATGNTLLGPKVEADGSATVQIIQSGAGNVVSKDGTDTAANNVFGVKDASNVSLTIKQVGDNNSLALSANADGATIGVYQGNGTLTGTGSKDDALSFSSSTAADGNTADVQIGTSANAAGAATLMLTQQSDGNYAKARLNAGFSGTLNLVQMGTTAGSTQGATPVTPGVGVTAGNWADITLSGSATHNIGQNGENNTLKLTSSSAGRVDINFGGVSSFTPAASAGTAVNNNNAHDWSSTNAGGSAISGIDLGATAGFEMAVNGSDNNIAIDMSTAGTTSQVSGLVVGSNADLTLIAASSGVLKINNVEIASGTSSMARNVVTIKSLGEVSIDGGSTSSSSVTSTATLGTSYIVQGDADDRITIGLNNTTGSQWNLVQTGGNGSTLTFDNWTDSAVIRSRQDSTDAAQSATGIHFEAASGTFTLYQK